MVKYYESIEYDKNSYYSLIWEIEKNYLYSELKRINKDWISYLDLACGTGRVISYLESLVEEATGVDTSEKMLEVAKSKVERAKLIKVNIIEEPLLGTFDVITVFRLFLNLEKEVKVKILHEVKNNMNHDSVLIFSIHGNKLSFRYFVFFVQAILGKN